MEDERSSEVELKLALLKQGTQKCMENFQKIENFVGEILCVLKTTPWQVHETKNDLQGFDPITTYV
jgi:hypothetical protein